MTNEIKSKIAGTAKSALPWQKGIAWWIVLLEGIVFVGLGLYMYFQKAGTFQILAWIIAISLIVSGGLSLYIASRNADKNKVRQWTMIHGAVGLVAGFIVILQLIARFSLTNLGPIVLGLGCLVYGGVGLYMLIEKDLVSLRRISALSTIFYLVIGILILFQRFGVGALATTIRLLNIIILVAGIVLILWSLVLRNESAKQVVKSND